MWMGLADRVGDAFRSFLLPAIAPQSQGQEVRGGWRGGYADWRYDPATVIGSRKAWSMKGKEQGSQGRRNIEHRSEGLGQGQVRAKSGPRENARQGSAAGDELVAAHRQGGGGGGGGRSAQSDRAAGEAARHAGGAGQGRPGGGQRSPSPLLRPPQSVGPPSQKSLLRPSSVFISLCSCSCSCC